MLKCLSASGINSSANERTMMMMMMMTTTTMVTKATTVCFKAKISTGNKSFWETKMHLFHYKNNR